MKKHTLYIIEAKFHNVTFYKVGMTKCIRNRLKNISTACPFHVQVVYSELIDSEMLARNLEKEAHKVMSSRNINGEWFNISKNDVVQIVKDLASRRCKNKGWFKSVRSYLRKTKPPVNKNMEPLKDKELFKSRRDYARSIKKCKSDFGYTRKRKTIAEEEELVVQYLLNEGFNERHWNSI